MNKDYGIKKHSFRQVPLPKNEHDKKFRHPERAYFDFIRSINDWYFGCYEECRRLWHEEGGRAPFLLQMSGYDAEKFMLARPQAWAFSWLEWLKSADGIGLSLYTNDGYNDYGHHSIQAMIGIFSSYSQTDKPVFVLEGGCEVPNATLRPAELKYIAAEAGHIFPKTFIYEFFKRPFYRKKSPEDGYLVSPEGQVSSEVKDFLVGLFSEEKKDAVKPETEKLVVIVDSDAVRDRPRLGEIYSTVLAASADIPIGFRGPRDVPPLTAGLVWTPELLTIHPASAAFQLINEAPRIGGAEYKLWIENLRRALP